MNFGNQERSYIPVFLKLLDAKIWQKTFGIKKGAKI